MFANKLFEPEDGDNVAQIDDDSSDFEEGQNHSRGMVSEQQENQNPQSGGGDKAKGETPQERRQRMQDMRRKALAKRNQRMTTTVVARSVDTKSQSRSSYGDDDGMQVSVHSMEKSTEHRAAETESLMKKANVNSTFDPTRPKVRVTRLVADVSTRSGHTARTGFSDTPDTNVEPEVNGNPTGNNGGSHPHLRTPAVIDPHDLPSFIRSPIPPHQRLQCYIVRNRKGLRNKLYPVYHLYLEQDDTMLLAAKKRGQNKTSNYLISSDAKTLTKDSSYFGKTRSNFVGTEFTVYDKGINPKDVSKKDKGISSTIVREELALVQYDSNFLGNRGPRKMTVYVPRIKDDGTRLTNRPLDDKSTSSARIKKKDMDDFIMMQNKPPTWNDQVCVRECVCMCTRA
jgi:tubby-related protein 1